MLQFLHVRHEARHVPGIESTIQNVSTAISRQLKRTKNARPFDGNQLSLSACLHPDGADFTRLLCRWMDRDRLPAHSSYGVEEIEASRRGSSLQIRRWSSNSQQPKLWLALFFRYWESKSYRKIPFNHFNFFGPIAYPIATSIEMVLFHCTFVGLKARCPLTHSMRSSEYLLHGERRLFQGCAYINLFPLEP